MLKGLNAYTKEEGLEAGYYCLADAFNGVSNDVKMVEQFKLGTFPKTERKLWEVKVLFLLGKLGFPLDSVGTYYYKGLIMRSVDALNDGEFEEDSELSLLSQLKAPYSQLYLEVARYNLGIGIKTFHRHVGQAIEAMSSSEENHSLVEVIYGQDTIDVDYGEAAYYIANYIHEKVPNLPKEDYEEEKKKINNIHYYFKIKARSN